MSFIDRKIRTLFSRFDINNNGFINIADFTLWGDRLIKTGTNEFLYIDIGVFSCITFFSFEGHLNSQNQAELRRCLTTLWYFLN